MKGVKHDHKTYVIDQIAKSKGVTVLRLPKYHNKLNPFDLAWPVVKNYVAHYSSRPISGRAIVINALAEVTREKWRQYIVQVKDAEEEISKLDRTIDNTTDSYLKFAGKPRYPGDEISSGYTDAESDTL